MENPNIDLKATNVYYLSVLRGHQLKALHQSGLICSINLHLTQK